MNDHAGIFIYNGKSFILAGSGMNYRFLTLVGGGSWALIHVKALIALYGAGMNCMAILKDFDMVAANSGGSIVLGALLEDLALKDILDLFYDEEKRKSVFSPTHSFGDQMLHGLTGLGPKYSSENKLAALQNVFPKTGTLPLKDAAVSIRRTGAADNLHLLITAFDYEQNRSCFFRFVC